MPTPMRYVGGGPAAILETAFQFQVYGQLVNVPDNLIERAKELSLIPVAMFDSLGHTADELKKWGPFERAARATEYPDGQAFLNKQRRAWMLLHQYRNPEPEAEERVVEAPPTTDKE